jgi:adenine-specific DNA methylase
LNDPFELPSLEEIKEMDKQRSQAIESLEIFDHSVKCQRCGIAVPIVGKLTTAKNDRIAILQKTIKWIESYNHGNRSNEVKQLKAELAELLEEDAKADKLRSLPLYSCRITGFKFVCSKCYDKVYYIHAIATTKSNIQKSL